MIMTGMQGQSAGGGDDLELDKCDDGDTICLHEIKNGVSVLKAILELRNVNGGNENGNTNVTILRIANN